MEGPSVDALEGYEGKVGAFTQCSLPLHCTPCVGHTIETVTCALLPQCLVLYTSYQSNQLFEVAWRKIETQLQSKGMDYTPIDGADLPNRDLRNALWAISGQRTYPQVRAATLNTCTPIHVPPSEMALGQPLHVPHARACHCRTSVIVARRSSFTGRRGAGLWAVETKSRSFSTRASTHASSKTTSAEKSGT